MPTLSPRKRFQKDAGAVRSHQDLVDSSAVQHSIDMALLQIEARYSADRDGTASLNFYRMQGARDFIAEWMLLAEPEPTRKFEPTDRLLDPDRPIDPKKKT